MEQPQNDDAMLQRYLGRMLPDESGIVGSDHSEQEKIRRHAVTQKQRPKRSDNSWANPKQCKSIVRYP
jgi:hypothetical protein